MIRKQLYIYDRGPHEGGFGVVIEKYFRPSVGNESYGNSGMFNRNLACFSEESQ